MCCYIKRQLYKHLLNEQFWILCSDRNSEQFAFSKKICIYNKKKHNWSKNIAFLWKICVFKLNSHSQIKLAFFQKKVYIRCIILYQIRRDSHLPAKLYQRLLISHSSTFFPFFPKASFFFYIFRILFPYFQHFPKFQRLPLKYYILKSDVRAYYLILSFPSPGYFKSGATKALRLILAPSPLLLCINTKNSLSTLFIFSSLPETA